MSDIDYYIENSSGAEFRAELNQLLQHIKTAKAEQAFVDAAITALQEGKLGIDDQAKDSEKLGGKSPSAYAGSIHSHGADDLPQGTTNAPGILQLLDSVTSTSTALAAPPNSVKTAYDRGDNAYKLAEAASKTAGDAYPKAGGDVTGAYNYAKATGIVITFAGKTVLERHSENGALSFGADEGVVIGSGEARALTVQNVSMSSEILHLSSDNTVIIRTNMQGGWSARKEFYFEGDGSFRPANVEKTREHLGVPSKAEARTVGEIVEFGFDEEDVPPGFFIMNNTRVVGGMLEPAYQELRDKCLGKFIHQSGDDFIVQDMPDFRRGKGSSSRAVGSYEGDAIRNISGTFYPRSTNLDTRGFYDPYASGAFYTSGSYTGSVTSDGSRFTGEKLYFSASRQVPTALENRPKSRTVLVCIYHGVGV